MADQAVKLGFWEKADRWLTGLMTIPILGIVIKSFIEKGKEITEKKIKKTLGMDTDAAAKDPEDEILYECAAKELGVSEKIEVEDFEIQLRSEDPKKAEAFVLWVAKIIKAFEKERKETINPPKGSSDPRKETIHRDISEGVQLGCSFIRSMLSRTGGTPEETFKKRIAFLQGKNVFSLIPKAKKEPDFLFILFLVFIVAPTAIIAIILLITKLLLG